jgi:hypothetical protein
MISKTELKQLIESLRDEVRELKTEIEVMKTLIVQEDKFKMGISTSAAPIRDSRIMIHKGSVTTTTNPYKNIVSNPFDQFIPMLPNDA